MAFDLDRWKQELRAHLDGWWLRAKRAGGTTVYSGLSAAALWPLLAAAQKGELTPVLLALGSVTGGVGANLIAMQIQSWKEQSRKSDEVDLTTWVEEHARRDEAVRKALDDILERLEAIAAAQTGLGDAERRAFLETLRTDLQRFGNLTRFQATLQGSGAIAQGERSVAAGAGGIAIGGEIRESVVATGDVFELIRRLEPGTRSKDEIDKEVREDRESWRTR